FLHFLSLFFTSPSTSVIYPLSLHDALPIFTHVARLGETGGVGDGEGHVELAGQGLGEEGLAAAGRADEEDVRLLKLDVPVQLTGDRKSTRLNSSHVKISYAVFCLKKKNTYY